MGREDVIRGVFSEELNEISDPTLREKIVKIWVDAWNKSKWENILRAMHPYLPGITLIEHTKAVFRGVKALAKVFEEIHGVKINYDLLYAAALLHDVSILLESEESDSGVRFSKFGELIPHAVYGGHLVFKYDLPLELAHLVLSHTRFSAIEPKMIEGVILHYVDYCDADVLRTSKGLEPFLLKEYRK